MKLTLISPADRRWSYSFVDFFSSMPLSLPLLGTLCPDDVEVAFVDEARREVDLSIETDLVGITVMLPFARRAAEIAGAFRRRNVPVIMGGYFPTLCPDRALEEADSIVVGEAEAIWPRVLEDFRQGRLERIYKAGERPDLASLPLIRRERMPEDSYRYHYNVETTRGCPHRCSYCSVRDFYSDTVRNRPVEDVVAQVRELRDKPIFFVDDNIGANIPYAKRLMRALAPLEILWFSQCSTHATLDDEFVELARESGCLLLYLGFETVNRASLEEVGRHWSDPDRYPEIIERLHRAGIGVYGSFMLGFDADGPDIFDRTLDFCIGNRLELATFYIYQPGPGRRKRLREEGRLRWPEQDEEWRLETPCFHPARMSCEELEQGYRRVWQRFYSKESIRSRIEPGDGPVKRDVPQVLRGQIPSLFELYSYINFDMRATVNAGMAKK